MKRTALALATILTLTIALLSSIHAIDLASANWGEDPLKYPFIKIISPLNLSSSYQNTTVTLEILAYTPKDLPEIRSIFYTLDEEPSVYLPHQDFKRSEAISYWARALEPSGYDLRVKFDLENLSEGNHTVKVYSVDVNGKEMSTYQNFTVNSFYQVTVIKVLSPTNQTYQKGMIPLIFTVNGEIKRAYYCFDPYGSFHKYPIDGNTTINSPLEGVHEMRIYVETEKGGATALTPFTISNNAIDLENPFTFLTTVAIVITLVMVVGVILYKRRKR